MLVESWVPAVQQNAAKFMGWDPQEVPGADDAGLARREDSYVAEPVLQNAGACVAECGGGIV